MDFEYPGPSKFWTLVPRLPTRIVDLFHLGGTQDAVPHREGACVEGAGGLGLLVADGEHTVELVMTRGVGGTKWGADPVEGGVGRVKFSLTWYSN